MIQFLHNLHKWPWLPGLVTEVVAFKKNRVKVKASGEFFAAELSSSRGR